MNQAKTVNQARNQLLVCDVTAVNRGDVFADGLPLHVTLQSWFCMPDDRQSVFESALGEIAAAQKAIPITGGDRALYGPDHTVPVTKVDAGKEDLRILHDRLGRLIKGLGGLLDTTRAGDGYSPHISDRHGGERVEPGAMLVLSGMYLVSRSSSDDGERRVTGVYRFAGEKQ